MGWMGLEEEEYDRQYKDTALLRRIFAYLAPYGRRMAVVVMLVVLSSLSYGLIPWVSSIIINDAYINRNLGFLVFMVLVALLLNVIGWLLNYVRQLNSVRVLTSIVLDMQKDAQAAVMDQDFYFYDRYAPGKVTSRVNSDTKSFSDMADMVMETAASLFTVIILFIPMVLINNTLSLWMLAIVPVIFVVATAYRRVARRRTLLGQRSLALVNSFVQENITGIKIAKTFRQEAKVFEKFKKINRQSYKVNFNRALVLNFIFPSLDISWGIFVALLVYFGGALITSHGLTPGNLYLFIQSAWNLFYPLFSVAAFWPQFQAGLSAAERVFAVIDAPKTVVQTGSEKLPILSGRIEFDNMIFEYVPGKKIFDGFSLDIQAGESVAIVGHTGAGKSTLAKLLVRFYEFQDGDIRVDGRSIRDVDLETYRRQVGYIPQLPFLWADSVESNIKYGVPNATREDVLRALEQAGGADWIDDLPQGLETDVSEKGKALSMGQRQLVALARIMLANPTILVLDEATASVDPFTETKIQDALEASMQNRTTIIIAHRLWTVRHANRIIVLDHGKIVEQGSHDELMAKGGAYANLYELYFKHQSFEFLESQGTRVESA
jgi:ABC-type multidrug transport system fused ATPase/permease subunit